MSDLGSSLTGSVTGSVESAKARVETAKSGKQMLDQGGPTKEAEVYALNAMRSARDTDDKLTKMLNDDVKMYEEAVRSIKKALASPPNTISMMPERITEFKTLLKQYEARLKSAKGDRARHSAVAVDEDAPVRRRKRRRDKVNRRPQQRLHVEALTIFRCELQAADLELLVPAGRGLVHPGIFERRDAPAPAASHVQHMADSMAGEKFTALGWTERAYIEAGHNFLCAVLVVVGCAGARGSSLTHAITAARRLTCSEQHFSIFSGRRCAQRGTQLGEWRS